MAGGFGAEINALRAAAGAAESASEQVAEIDLADAISGAAAGMPGARAQQALTAVGQSWQTDVSSWVGWADQYATALGRSADGYAADESASERDFKSR